MKDPDNENPDLTPEALVAHRAATRKIVADFIERGEQPDTRTQKEIDESLKSMMENLDRMGKRVIDAGYTEEELNKIIEEEIEAVRQEEKVRNGFTPVRGK